MTVHPSSATWHRLLVVALIATAASAGGAQVSSSASPGPGANRAIGFYDATLGRVVIVGGADQPRSGSRDRVWSWSGRRWELVTDSGPTARGNAAAAYDARRRVAVVTGGAQSKADGSGFEIIADTWEGASGKWHRITGIDVRPRDHLAMVYDARREAVLAFGGAYGPVPDPWPSDTWQLGASGWQRIATDGPAGRARSALVYDSRRQQVVLFGGVGAPPGPGQPQPFFNDTWVLEGDAWRKVASAGPRARYAHGMVFDERAGVVLMYSGAAAHRGAPLSDMWQWDGTRWTEIRLTGPTPGYRYQPIMVYDRARGRTVLYGGIDGSRDDTWEWDGRQWTEVRPR